MTDGIRVVCSVCGWEQLVEPDTPPGSEIACAECGEAIVVPDGGVVLTFGTADLAGSQDDTQVSIVSAPTMNVSVAGDGQVGESSAVEALLTGSADSSAKYIECGTIGRGGMGRIVLCVDRNTRRQVAMKRMLPKAAAKPAYRARFVEEAQVTAQLEHPNIVPVHELERADDGTIYFTMKLVKGRSLGQVLKAARDDDEDVTLIELLEIFQKVCDGVGFAHSRGVVHRDLKPDNIMVGDFGEVLVMDWGLAKIVGREDIRTEDPIASSRRELDQPELYTMAGATLGSPSYMSPEQAAGEIDRIDHRSDIYSLGVILYEMLTHRKPITGETARTIVAKVVQGKIVPPERCAPDRAIPRELSAVAMKCLAKARPNRYQSTLALRHDITLYLAGRSVSAAPDTFPQAAVKLIKRNKVASAAAAAAAAIIIALTATFMVRLKGERDVALTNEQRAVASERRAVASEQDAITERRAAQDARDRQRATALAASQELAERAVRAADQERWDEADISAAAARNMLPDSPWGHYAAGIVALARKDRETAQVELKKALACDQGHAPSRATLGRIAALEGKLAEASALLGDPGKSKDWHAFRTAGDTLTSQQRYRDAETAYARSLDLLTQPQRLGEDQKDWRALVAMGDTFLAQEFYADAVAAYERARKQMSNAKAVPPKAPNQIEKKLESSRKAHEAPRTNLEYKKGDAAAWVKCEGFYDSIEDLPAKEQVERIRAKLNEIHGGDVGFKYTVEDGVLVGVGGTSKRARRPVYLQPLAHLPLTKLGLGDTHVRDLGPLKGMPLKELSVGLTRITDLTPLRGMPLTSLDCSRTSVSDLGPLKGMPLKDLNARQTRITNLTALKGMSLTRLDLTDCPLLTSLKGIEGMLLTDLSVKFCGALRGDLSALKGMKLTKLSFGGCSSLTGLKGLDGMALTRLDLAGCSSLMSLEGIEGMPLTSLELKWCPALRGDLSALKGMKLTYLNLERCSSLTSLRGIEGMRLTSLRCDRTRISDLTPLKDMSLQELTVNPKNITKGIEIIRGMKSLRKIRLGSLHPFVKSEEFWKKYDAGEFDK